MNAQVSNRSQGTDREYTVQLYACDSPAQAVRFVLGFSVSPGSGDRTIEWVRGDAVADSVFADVDATPPGKWQLLSTVEVRSTNGTRLLEAGNWADFHRKQ